VIEQGFFLISTDLIVKTATLDCKEDDAIYEKIQPKSGFYKETIPQDEIKGIVSSHGGQAIVEPSPEQMEATIRAYKENEEKLRLQEIAEKEKEAGEHRSDL
jgi:hypothetical protein